MAAKALHGLTVIISRLQSLMKDQVGNLNEAGIVDAVTANGLFDPIERTEAYRRLRNGNANLLYISPENLRSKIIGKILESRIDYLADILGLEKQEVITVFNLMRQESILDDMLDMERKKMSRAVLHWSCPNCRQVLAQIRNQVMA